MIRTLFLVLSITILCGCGSKTHAVGIVLAATAPDYSTKVQLIDQDYDYGPIITCMFDNYGSSGNYVTSSKVISGYCHNTGERALP